MLQAASNPLLLSGSKISETELVANAIKEGGSEKLAFTCQLTRKLVKEGKKVLIWSSFVNTVEHLAVLLEDIGAHFIHGGVPTGEEDEAFDTRESKIRDFNNPRSECKVLIANPAACSEGISLHKTCHHAIYIDRNYNAAHYLQSEDRIHRIGLTPETDTHIYILKSIGTIDESVDRRLIAKVSAMAEVLNDSSLNIRPLDFDSEDEYNGLDSDDIIDIKNMLGMLE